MGTLPPIVPGVGARPWASTVTAPVGVAEYWTLVVRSCDCPLTMPVTMYCWVCGPLVLLTISVAVDGERVSPVTLVGGLAVDPPLASLPPPSSPGEPPLPVGVGCAGGLN